MSAVVDMMVACVDSLQYEMKLVAYLWVDELCKQNSTFYTWFAI